jgi:hypothetical protein
MLVQPRQAENRLHQGTVRKPSRLKVGHHVRGEQAAKRRKSQKLLAAGQSAEHHRQSVPLVMMGVPSRAADRAIAQ